MIQTQTTLRVRYAETDKMGLVYHANYLTWFELARIVMLDELGYPYKQLEADGYFIPVLEVSARYLKPAHFDDTITVMATMPEKPFVRFGFSYEVKRGDELLATGTTKHAFMSPAGEPLRPPKALLERLAKHF
ncbi:MAG: thioesterase family protein [Verrucomicrobiota bacterium]